QHYQLSSVVEDGPITIALPNGQQWTPQNFSRESYGRVPLYQAMARSYNQATARLGMELGVSNVVRTLKRAGLTKNLDAYPSLLLGAVALSPFEVSHLYHTLAADGVYTPLRAIRSVLDASHSPLKRYPLSSEPRFSAEHAHLIHYALQASVRNGTGRSIYHLLPQELALAGKTGTSNQQRDSWFAGYSGDHLAVVWVGNDDNKPTPFTGSSGALPVWTSLFQQLTTTSVAQTAPSAIEYYWMDSASGLRSAEGCAGAQLMPFIAGTQPQAFVDCDLARPSVKGWFKRWLQPKNRS
ncbi:MAG: penicillin-binding transpeptidase domain-containing protein, partial [Pseudomonadota bacterium]